VYTLYFSLATLMLIMVPAETMVTYGADASSWLSPAYSLLKHLDFVMLENPDIRDFYRPPVIPIFNALWLGIGGEYGIKLTVFAQIVLLAVTGYMAALIAYQIMPALALPTLILLLFNPNSLGTALLIQSEAVFTFLFTASLYFLYRTIDKLDIPSILLSALFLGIACLARPSVQYLIILFPIIIVTLGLFYSNQPAILLKTLGIGLAGMVLALTVVFPWALSLAKIEGKLSLSPASIKSIYLGDQLITLRASQTGAPMNEISQAMHQEDFNGYSGIRCDALKYENPEKVKCYQGLLDARWDAISDARIIDYAKTIFRSTANYLFSGAAGTWHNLLDTNRGAMVGTSASSQASAASAIVGGISGLGLPALFISFVCIFYSVTIKILGLVGLVAFFRCKQWAELAICLGVIIYFLAVSLFLGHSRYRVPAETTFVILAAMGLITIIPQLRKN